MVKKPSFHIKFMSGLWLIHDRFEYRRTQIQNHNLTMVEFRRLTFIL